MNYQRTVKCFLGLEKKRLRIKVERKYFVIFKLCVCCVVLAVVKAWVQHKGNLNGSDPPLICNL